MSPARDICAVVPVKEIEGAKSRLARRFSAAFRRQLAHAMLEDVLGTLTATSGLAGIVVVSIDPGACALARRRGARIFVEAARDGHTAAVMAAARRLASEGRAGMLTVPGDIPGVTVGEVSRLLDAHGEAPAFTIAPSHDRRGSNAIVVSPPDAVQLAFGDDSFVRHVAIAQRAGIEATILSLPGIGLDIDEPADLECRMRAGTGRHTSQFLLAQSQNEPLRAVSPAHG